MITKKLYNQGRPMFRTLLLLLIIAMPTGSALGAELRVVTEEWPPYNYSDHGKITGVVSEVVLAALDRSGLDYTVEVLPWARAYELARTEPNVMIYSILKLPSRAPSFNWVKLDGLSVEMYLFRPNFLKNLQIQTLADAKRFRVGVTRDTSTHHFLLAHGFKAGKNLFPVNCEQFNTLKSRPETRRVDLATGDRLSMGHVLKEAGMPPGYWVPELLLFKEDLYMAFSLKTPDEKVERVLQGLEMVRADGTLARVVDKYNHMFE